MHPLNPCPPDREIGVLPDHSKVGANCLLARTQSTLLLCTRPFQGGPVHERSTLPCEIRANQAVGLPPDWNGLRVLGEAGSQAFFRVDTFRVRRSGSSQLSINNEAAPALLSTDFCLAMSPGLIPV